ncbi:hypothetical protein CEV33_0205 [Brucella grignonensis]|uniref:Uncharacterized protein n=1 Tax=Brucella grignonensis TaxID=94627 RepID=A0A256FLG5_9HYPH|nr:hypothetical protein CEV33_0205 [Brucella grignonensis]
METGFGIKTCVEKVVFPAKVRSGFARDNATREQSERRRDTPLAPL